MQKSVIFPFVLALEEEFLQNLGPADSGQAKPLPALESILANMKFTPTALPTDKPKEAVSSETMAILRTLPDLSFMRAKVLMFPFRAEAFEEG